MFYVYVLRLSNSQFYVGRSDDLRRRFHEHMQGKVKSTQKRRPLSLVFYEAFILKEDGIRRERYFKTSKGKSTIRIMLQSYLSGL